MTSVEGPHVEAALLDARLIHFTAEDPEGWQLVGSTCEHCAARVHPPRSLCPRCGARMNEATLSKRGTLLSSTIVEQATPTTLLNCPYHVGLIDLDDGGPILEAVGMKGLSGQPLLAVGSRVRLVIEELDKPRDGIPLSVYRFAAEVAG